MSRAICAVTLRRCSWRSDDQMYLCTHRIVLVRRRFSHWPQMRSGLLGHVFSAAKRKENVTRFCQFVVDVPGTAATVCQTNNMSRRLTITGRQHAHCEYDKQALVLDTPGDSFLRSLDISRVDAAVPLPVESRPHMPMLIHSCKYIPRYF